jgi:hypothetical protein
MTVMFHAEAFGLRWRSDILLPDFDPADAAVVGIGAPIEVVRVDRLPDRGLGRPINRGLVYDDGIRFLWNREVGFDMHDGTRIAYAPGPDWTGEMPACFYGTVAALTAAWRGLVPLHACAVELDGRAVLIAGEAGAGKSTLAAQMVASGASFVADDLTVVAVTAGAIAVMRGRRTMRLHPDTAARLKTSEASPIAGDNRGKWLVSPQRRCLGSRLDPSAILLLEGATPGRLAPPIRLFSHVFRRQWMNALPMREALMADVLAITAAMPLIAYPPQDAFDPATRARRPAEVAAIVRSIRPR